jgi:hypothetical protein
MKPSNVIRGAIALLAAWLVAAGPAVAQAPEGRLYTPGPFDSVEISGAAAVRFTQGDSDQVFVEGDEATQRSVEVELRNGLLMIHPSGSWKFWSNKRVQLAVTARELKRVTISGAADFVAAAPVQARRLSLDISGAGLARFDQLKAEELRFSVSGSGDAQVAGSVERLVVGISGRSDFRGENLMSQQARVTISGLGGVKVWAQQELAISISGIGTVDYWGSPSVRRSASGMATVNDRGPKAPAQ